MFFRVVIIPNYHYILWQFLRELLLLKTLSLADIYLTLYLKVAFIQKVRFVFQISKTNIPNHCTEPVSVDLRVSSIRLAPSSGISIVWRADSWRRRHAAPQLAALQTMEMPLDGAKYG